jgi:hypothetical protein
LALAVLVPPAGAAPPALRDYLRACGISADDFARFRHDRQMADEELDVVHRIAVRLGDCPADSLRQLIAQEPAAQLEGAGESQRGRPLRLQGRVESIEQSADTLWRCTIAGDSRPHRAMVYVVGQNANLPEAMQIGNLPHVGDRIAAEAVFVKFVPGAKDQPVPVFVAGRLQQRAGGSLGDLDFDAGLLGGLRDNAPLTVADSDAFYRLLLLTKTADAAKLRHEATFLDATAAARLFRQPAGDRGRLFHISGTARRVVRVPIDDPVTAARLGADHYFQIDLIGDALQDNPLVFCTLALPPGMPLGGPGRGWHVPELAKGVSTGENTPFADAQGRATDYGQPIEVTGFFLKTWQYPTGLTASERAAHPGASRALQAAPLLIGPPPRWEPVSAGKKSLPGWAVGGLLVLAMTGLGLLLLHLRQSDQEFMSRSQL